MTSSSACVGSSISVFLAFCWLGVLFIPMDWITTMNSLWISEISLLSLQMRPGSIVSGIGLIASLSSTTKEYYDVLASFFNHKMSVDDAAQRFCAAGIDTLFKWCNEWQQLRFSSYALILSGLLTVIFLILGAGFMFYYSTSHATHTGRMWIRACFIIAPFLVLCGMTQYTLLNLELGKVTGNPTLAFLGNSTCTYGIGFFLGWFLVLLTFVPIFIQATFGRVARNEKGNGDSSDEEERLYANTNYGSTMPPPPPPQVPGVPPQPPAGAWQGAPAQPGVSYQAGYQVAYGPGYGTPAF